MEKRDKTISTHLSGGDQSSYSSAAIVERYAERGDLVFFFFVSQGKFCCCFESQHKERKEGGEEGSTRVIYHTDSSWF